MAVDDLAEGLSKGLAVVGQDLTFEEFGVQGVGVAEQEQVKSGGELLEKGHHFRPESGQHGVPGVLDVFDGRSSPASVPQGQQEFPF